MTVSLRAFRDRCPDATLQSEILMVKDDQFVVKVTITTTSSGQAAGLAADLVIEAAEDRARQRALAGLGLYDVSDLSPKASQSSSEVDATDTLPPEIALPVSTKATAVPSSALDSDSGPPKLLETTVLTPVRSATQKIEKAEPQVSSTPQAVAKTSDAPVQLSEPVKTDEPIKTDELVKTDEPVKTVVATIDATIDSESAQQDPGSAAPLPAPINLSDVIAQTDIELRRLGWSVETGREYLERNYNKRSRHELSEEELIQFLCYLESLSESQVSN
ncbi:hypothetical protein PN498_19105 [Oscillatoria sp. CS-180]|uniref:hypothetical protein n=1 Tax=Oscillatoria sp. CS-180 TaxID=3021720 RepID=UPI00232D923D|nr:hypothetical protein [Oscillatoria sp. CS-180]MDB9528109.1 hypothetical protein [Oscillatoria sp. CS-180]